MRRVSFQVFSTVDVLKLADECLWRGKNVSNRWERKREVWGGLFALLGEVAGVALVCPISGYL